MKTIQSVELELEEIETQIKKLFEEGHTKRSTKVTLLFGKRLQLRGNLKYLIRRSKLKPTKNNRTNVFGPPETKDKKRSNNFPIFISPPTENDKNRKYGIKG